MVPNGFLTAAVLGAGYIGLLTSLFRWCAASKQSHVLALDCGGVERCAPCKARRFHMSLAVGLAVALFCLEASGFMFLARLIGFPATCPASWLPLYGCTLSLAHAQPGASTAAGLLLGCVMVLLIARRAMPGSAFYPLTLLLIGIISVGAAVDLVAGSSAPARPQLVLRLATGLQVTAAVAFVLGLMILRGWSLAAFIRAVTAHAAGAGVRALGVLSMLAVWPHLPPASAIALLIAFVLVPGIATALTSVAALSTSQQVVR